MALYTRLWAANKLSPHPFARQQQLSSTLTFQAALEIINTTATPTHREIKLAYSLWKNQMQNINSAPKQSLH